MPPPCPTKADIIGVWTRYQTVLMRAFTILSKGRSLTRHDSALKLFQALTARVLHVGIQRAGSYMTVGLQTLKTLLMIYFFCAMTKGL
jgi:hypothetical protein